MAKLYIRNRKPSLKIGQWTIHLLSSNEDESSWRLYRQGEETLTLLLTDDNLNGDLLNNHVIGCMRRMANTINQSKSPRGEHDL